MAYLIDLSGRRFGRLTVQRRAENGNDGAVRWECRCDCGATKNVRSDKLRSGNTRSCGCLLSERASETWIKHGMTGTRTYNSWLSMMQRCNNPNHTSYGLYGAIGITVCDGWHDIRKFIEDMGERPDGASLDRVDNDKGYSPENCRWASRDEQAANKRGNRAARMISPKGHRVVVRAGYVNKFCKLTGLQHAHVYDVLLGKAETHKGWRGRYL